jgi:hypothetical protein
MSTSVQRARQDLERIDGQIRMLQAERECVSAFIRMYDRYAGENEAMAPVPTISACQTQEGEQATRYRKSLASSRLNLDPRSRTYRDSDACIADGDTSCCAPCRATNFRCPSMERK